MHLERDKLVWMALAALDEMIHQAKEAPLAPTLAIRTVLATAYALSDGNRDHFDSFWKEMQDPHAYCDEPHAVSYTRQTMMRASLRGIVRSLGVPDRPETDARMARMWRREKVDQGAAVQSQE